ncbi:putative uncharacterized protein DDB_G0285119 [Condylostylus longicornis]|uniref:putative uncharacterized protein DDB_G0285119 n=1 Tax=Condylostylus longicornis TaxID=2530218 RepID=UPI00244E1BC3|nr:putative uncharacterized protein DDB_G0285119 [Condylostylus longicornis]
MLTTKFQTLYIGLVFFVLLLKLSISNSLPTTSETKTRTTTKESSSSPTTSSEESNIISFLNQPGHGKTHLSTNDNKNQDENDEDDNLFIKPLDDILGLNFDLFDTWAKNSNNNSKGSSSSPSDNNNNTDSFNISSTTTFIPTDNNNNNSYNNNHNNNENTSTEYSLFPRRPLQRFHNTLHRIFSSISNRISSNGIEQRDYDDRILQHQREQYKKQQEQKLQKHRQHFNQTNNNSNSSEKINTTNIFEIVDDKNSANNLSDNNNGNSKEKSQFENVVKSTSSLNFSGKNHNYRSLRLIDDSTSKESSTATTTTLSNNLFMRSSSNSQTNYDQNTIIDPNHIIVSMKNITIDANNLYTSESTLSDDDLFNLDENNDNMNNIHKNNNNSNNLFITTTGFRNKTRAFITFIFTPLSNLWSIAQRNLPIWPLNVIRNNNDNNNMMEDETFTITSNQNNIEDKDPSNKNDTGVETTNNRNNSTLLQIDLFKNNHLQNISQTFLNNFRPGGSIPSVLSRIRQSVSLPFYQNPNNSIKNVYRRINERMPFRKEFRKYVTPADDLIVNESFESTTSTSLGNQNHRIKDLMQKQRLIDQSSKEEQNGLENKTNKTQNMNYNGHRNRNNDDDDDDDDDDRNIVILNSKEDDDEIQHKPPVSASPRVYSENLGIYILEIFGTIIGLTWGALSTIQNLFTKSS